MSKDSAEPSPLATVAQAYLPRFQIQSALGFAAQGEIFRALDLPSGDTILVKAIPKQRQAAAGGTSWDSLLAETSRLATIFHPRIANLLELVDAPEALVMALAMPAGSSLKRMLAKRQPERDTIVGWTIDLLQVLAELHASGVVHRFLSPNSIVIDKASKACVCGFSLTSFTPRRETLVSPEARGGGPADQRSDIYAVGALLRFMLEQVGSESLGLGDPLRTALLRALAERPEDRFEEAVDMAHALREARQGHEQVPSEDEASPAETVPLPTFVPAESRLPAGADVEAGMPEGAETEAVGGRGSRRSWLALAAVVLAGLMFAAFSLGRLRESRPHEPAGASSGRPADEAGRADVASVGADMAGKPKAPMGSKPANDDTDRAIDTFLGRGTVDNLFRHAAIPAGDRALLEEVSADLASVDFHGDPRGGETVDTLFANNPLLDGTNPFLRDEARERWLKIAAHELGSDTAIAHLENQSRLTDAGAFDRAAWYEHVAACEVLCGMVVVGLFYEHIQQVAESPHELIRFGLDRRSVDQEGSRQIAALAGAVGQNDRLLLVGRASRLGDRVYNDILSGQRVEAVRKAVTDAGVDPSQIHGFGLGYEPPQLTPEIARRYGIEGVATTELNQSVLVVVFPARQESSRKQGQAHGV